MTQATQFASLMEMPPRSWTFVDHYRKIMSYRGSTVYIVGDAMDRPDYGAIEGLYLMANCTVIDTNE